MNVWDLFRKYNCINIEIDSIEEMKEMKEMKEMLELAKKITLKYLTKNHKGIYVYFERNRLEYTNIGLIDRQRVKQYNYDFQKIKHHLK